jgi:hypothetical protein
MKTIATETHDRVKLLNVLENKRASGGDTLPVPVLQ